MSLNQQTFQQLSHLELLAKQVVEGFITGLHKSPFHGFSVEFAEHRIYNPGESTRHIDWKLFGRTDKLFTKRYEEETNLRCQIVIDTSGSMYFPLSPAAPVFTAQLKNAGKESAVNKLAFSVYCAAALIWLLKKQRDAVGLSLFSDKIEFHSAAKSGNVHHKLLFSELEKQLLPPEYEERKKTFTSQALDEIAEIIHKRSLVIIFSDMLQTPSSVSEKNQVVNLFSALRHLRHNQHEVVLFHVTEKSTEENFQFENRPYRFVDMETGEQVKVHPGEIRESYISSMASYKKELMLRCAQYRIDFVEADIRKGFRQVLLPYLIKRTKMH